MLKEDVTLEGRLPEPIRSGALAAVPGVSHGFFTRAGGSSTGLYRGLNCGVGSRDDPARVAANRRRVEAALGVPAGHLLTAYQVHSATALTVDEPFRTDDRPRVDALATATPGIAVAALAADCVPVLLAARDGRAVAAAHAGWRGALGGILEATLEALERLGTSAGDVAAAVGPAISRAAYEVGPEFIDTFLDEDPDSRPFFHPADRRGHARFDLPGYVAGRLRKAGVAAVETLAACTYSDEARFYSYRRACHRGESDYGRLVSAIALTGA